MHHLVSPLSIRSGFLFNWVSEWVVYYKSFYFLYFRIDILLNYYFKCSFSVKKIVKIGFVLNKYRFFILNFTKNLKMITEFFYIFKKKYRIKKRVYKFIKQKKNLIFLKKFNFKLLDIKKKNLNFFEITKKFRINSNLKQFKTQKPNIYLLNLLFQKEKYKTNKALNYKNFICHQWKKWLLNNLKKNGEELITINKKKEEKQKKVKEQRLLLLTKFRTKDKNTKKYNKFNTNKYIYNKNTKYNNNNNTKFKNTRITNNKFRNKMKPWILKKKKIEKEKKEINFY